MRMHRLVRHTRSSGTLHAGGERDKNNIRSGVIRKKGAGVVTAVGEAERGDFYIGWSISQHKGGGNYQQGSTGKDCYD